MILNITVKVRKKNANLYDYSIVAEKVKIEIDYFRNVHKHKDLEASDKHEKKKQTATKWNILQFNATAFSHKPNSLKTVPLTESWITGHPVWIS